MAANYLIIDTSTDGDTGTIPVGAKTISIEVKGLGTVVFGAYTLQPDAPAFTIEAPNNTLLPATAYDATGSRAFIVATFMQ